MCTKRVKDTHRVSRQAHLFCVRRCSRIDGGSTRLFGRVPGSSTLIALLLLYHIVVLGFGSSRGADCWEHDWRSARRLLDASITNRRLCGACAAHVTKASSLQW